MRFHFYWDLWGQDIRAWPPQTSDVNKDLTFKAKDKDQTLNAKDQDKDQTYKDKDQDKDQTPKDKDKDQTFKAKDQDKDLVNYGASSPWVYFCPSEMLAFARQ